MFTCNHQINDEGTQSIKISYLFLLNTILNKTSFDGN